MTARPPTSSPHLLDLQSNANTLRIALLGYRSHPHVGGQGIYLKYLSRALTEMGHQVDVISGPPYPELDDNVGLVKLPSLDLYAHPNPTKALTWKHLRSFSDSFEWFSKLTGGFAEPYTFSRRAYKYIRANKHKYDVIHDNQCLGYGLLKLQKLGIPVVSTIHHPITRDRQLALDAESDWGMRLLVRRWYAFLGMQTTVAQRLHHVITVSRQSMQDIFLAFGRETQGTQVIPNGIDTNVFKPRPELAKVPFRIITTASSDQPLKGQRVLLEAIAQLRAQYPQLHLQIVGKLKAGGSTETLLQDLKLQDCVSFLQGISTQALAEAMNQAQIAITPSLYEGFGLPAGEAMASGTAVISSDGGALPEIVGKAGMVVPAGDSQALAKAIAQLFDDDTLRGSLEQAGRKRIESEFSWPIAAASLTAYYQDMLSDAKPAIPLANA